MRNARKHKSLAPMSGRQFGDVPPSERSMHSVGLMTKSCKVGRCRLKPVFARTDKTSFA